MELYSISVSLTKGWNPIEFESPFPSQPPPVFTYFVFHSLFLRNQGVINSHAGFCLVFTPNLNLRCHWRGTPSSDFGCICAWHRQGEGEGGSNWGTHHRSWTWKGLSAPTTAGHVALELLAPTPLLSVLLRLARIPEGGSCPRCLLVSRGLSSTPEASLPPEAYSPRLPLEVVLFSIACPKNWHFGICLGETEPLLQRIFCQFVYFVGMREQSTHAGLSGRCLIVIWKQSQFFIFDDCLRMLTAGTRALKRRIFMDHVVLQNGCSFVKASHCCQRSNCLPKTYVSKEKVGC